MCTNDGRKLLTTNREEIRVITCSRWEELTDTLHFHAEAAKLANAPTQFRIINNFQPFLVGADENDLNDYNNLLEALNSYPSGGTPLCQHIYEVTAEITRAIARGMHPAGTIAHITIFTDGEPTDGDLTEALNALRTLPVQVTIRFCTDNSNVVNYWNDIDKAVEVRMDILDDLTGEAKEIFAINPWLTYCDQLHKAREFGMARSEFDILDEKKFTLDQIRRFAAMIFGVHEDTYPHPEVDWEGFCAAIGAQKNCVVYSPVSKRRLPMIIPTKLNDPLKQMMHLAYCNYVKPYLSNNERIVLLILVIIVVVLLPAKALGK